MKFQLIPQLMKLLSVPLEYQPFVEWGLRIVAVILVLLFFSFFARKKRLQRSISWMDTKVDVVTFTSGDLSLFVAILRLLLWLACIILVLYILRLTGLFATVGISAGALTAIAAIANKELLGNVFACFVLQARRQVTPDDAVKVMGLSGTLIDVGITSCAIQDFDGVVHYIPNAKLLNEVLTNYSKAPYRRIQIDFWIMTSDRATAQTVELLEAFFQDAPGQHAEQKPFYRFGQLKDRAQEVKAFLYLDPDGWGENESKIRQLLVDRLLDAGLSLAVPTQLNLSPDNK